MGNYFYDKGFKMLELLLSQMKQLTEPGLEINPEVFQKLMANDGAASDSFGFNVAVSGDGSTVVVGAFLDDDRGADSGSAYVFTKQVNGSYLQTQKLVASDGAGGDQFGVSVAVSADGLTIIVGASYDDDKGNNSGSAYIYTKQVNGSYLRTQKLTASDGAANDSFGISVAITTDGSTVVIGSYGDDAKGAYSGSAYIFTKQANGSYLRTQKLVATDGVGGDYFGYRVAVSGDGSTVVVGAYGDDDKGTDSGSVYVFTKQVNGSYLQTQKLVASDGAGGDRFGYSVATSGDGSTIIVGSDADDDKGTNSGSVYVFTKQTNGSYLQFQKLLASDGASYDYFGYSVAVSGDGYTIIVGAYQDDDKGYNSGSAYIFTKQTNGSYLQTQKLTASDGATNDIFGRSVAISNTSVTIGAQNHLGKGAVYVY